MPWRALCGAVSRVLRRTGPHFCVQALATSAFVRHLYGCASQKGTANRATKSRSADMSAGPSESAIRMQKGNLKGATGDSPKNCWLRGEEGRNDSRKYLLERSPGSLFQAGWCTSMTRHFFGGPIPFPLSAATFFLLLTGCGSPASEPPTGEGSTTVQVPDTPPAAATPSDPPALPVAPWLGRRLSDSEVPAVFTQQWALANNRDSCALIAPIALGPGAEAVPRAATFSGGWAVAYDRPGLRSAFGIAGTSVPASGPAYDEWPYTRRWSDGSSAGYGPEGGTGPSQLAYLRIAGQSCLYNVWSNVGREHLEFLLEQLRFVEPGSAATERGGL